MANIFDFPPQLYSSPQERMRDEQLNEKCRADLIRLIEETWTGDEMKRVGCKVLLELGATYAVLHTGKEGAAYLLDLCREQLDRWETEWQQSLNEDTPETN